MYVCLFVLVLLFCFVCAGESVVSWENAFLTSELHLQPPLFVWERLSAALARPVICLLRVCTITPLNTALLEIRFPAQAALEDQPPPNPNRNVLECAVSSRNPEKVELFLNDLGLFRLLDYETSKLIG